MKLYYNYIPQQQVVKCNRLPITDQTDGQHTLVGIFKIYGCLQYFWSTFELTVNFYITSPKTLTSQYYIS